jgi:hypothetical protein
MLIALGYANPLAQPDALHLAHTQDDKKRIQLACQYASQIILALCCAS